MRGLFGTHSCRDSEGDGRDLLFMKQSIDASRIRRAFRELDDFLLHQVDRGETGPTGLSGDERIYFSVFTFDGTVCNGGMLSFFGNARWRHVQ